MFKKILAGLAILGMLMVGGLATAGKTSEDIPLVHKMAYKVTDQDLVEIFDYVIDNGYFNVFTYLFGGVLRINNYFADEDVSLKFEDYTRIGGKAAFVMDVPYDGERTLVFLEYFSDGDLLVDAVGIRDENGITAIRYDTDEIPSIYSSIYKKTLSRLVHKYAYNTPIKHATIKMGDN